MKETRVQIDGMMSIGDDAGVEKQSTRVSPDDIYTFIVECGYHCRGEVMPAHVCEPGTLVQAGRGPPCRSSSHVVQDSSFALLIDRKWRGTPC